MLIIVLNNIDNFVISFSIASSAVDQILELLLNRWYKGTDANHPKDDRPIVAN